MQAILGVSLSTFFELVMMILQSPVEPGLTHESEKQWHSATVARELTGSCE